MWADGAFPTPNEALFSFGQTSGWEVFNPKKVQEQILVLGERE
jgi:hypothetical protein